MARRLPSSAYGAFALVSFASVLSACTQKKETVPVIGTVVVDRRTIVVDAQATGVVEPINVVDVKSKASGLIIKMPVEIGSQVGAGQLLVQIDTRDVKNQYDQSLADQRSAQAALENALAQKKRSDELYKTRVITTQEYETATLALTQAQGSVVRANANLDIAKQRLEDATVVAPIGGTVIAKPVSLGTIITSSTGAFGGGTTILQMADLSKVRMRALVNETDIGHVQPGQTARVTVDAYPDKPFQGTVEKIEPQAVVQQSVTMFPVIISLNNNEGFLKPGMNGEVSMLVERRENVVAVANDAVRTTREAATAATFVGLNPDSVVAMVRAEQAKMGGGGAGGRGGRNGGQGQPAGDAPAMQSVPMTADAGAAKGAGAGGARGAGRGRGGDSSGAGAGAAAGEGRGKGRGGMGGNGGASRGGNAVADAGAQSGGGRGRGGMGSQGAGGQGGNGGGGGSTPSVTRARSGLVFVQAAGKFEPRLVRLGASNYDYSEVLSGLKEGEKVATLNVAALQAKRDQQNDRFRSMTAVPGAPAPTPGRGGAGGPGGGGGGGGGGGRPPGGR